MKGRRAGWANIYTSANIIGTYHFERWKQQKVEHKPATTYIVSVLDKPHWRTILTNKDQTEAEALEQAMLALSNVGFQSRLRFA